MRPGARRPLPAGGARAARLPALARRRPVAHVAAGRRGAAWMRRGPSGRGAHWHIVTFRATSERDWPSRRQIELSISSDGSEPTRRRAAQRGQVRKHEQRARTIGVSGAGRGRVRLHGAPHAPSVARRAALLRAGSELAGVRLVIRAVEEYALTGADGVAVHVHLAECAHAEPGQREHRAADREGDKLREAVKQHAEHNQIERDSEDVVHRCAHLLRHELGLEHAHRREVGSCHVRGAARGARVGQRAAGDV